MARGPRRPSLKLTTTVNTRVRFTSERGVAASQGKEIQMRKRLTIGRLTLLSAALLASWGDELVADTRNEVHSTLDAISNTAAIVEGHVVDYRYAFDAASGPRTTATLSNVTTHFGTFRNHTLTVATLGGPITQRRWLFIPDLPRLTVDTRYLMFLTNVDWFYTPVVGNYIFRLEPGPAGADVLIDPSGHAVVGVSAAGLRLTPDPVVDGQFDFLTPQVKPKLLDPKGSQLATAMSKDAFLTSIRQLLASAPLTGEFRTHPTAGRVWNRGNATTTLEKQEIE
jgi:hypothetical protein